MGSYAAGMGPENCVCSSFILALPRTKLHFGLLHLLDVFEVGSQLCQSLTSEPVRMLNAFFPAAIGGYCSVAVQNIVGINTRLPKLAGRERRFPR
jgi:hypothetical protein